MHLSTAARRKLCMVAAEARASGLPLIVPDRGAAIDQLVRAGVAYEAGSARSRGNPSVRR